MSQNNPASPPSAAVASSAPSSACGGMGESLKNDLRAENDCRCTPDGIEPACPIHEHGMDISERDDQ